MDENPTPIIREAEERDLEAIFSMQRSLGEAELPYDRVIDMPGLRSRDKWGYVGYVDIHKKMTSDDHYVLVADVAGEAVGVCYGQLKKDEDWSLLTHFGYVGCVFVEEKYRGRGEQGVWPRMLDALESWFKGRGVTQMRLECYVDNIAAVKAYSKNSFKPLQYVMAKEI